MRPDEIEEFKRVLEEARKNPGKRFKDPRFRNDEPSFTPGSRALQVYVATRLPGFEFFGPRTRYSMRSQEEGPDELFVAADLTGNGLSDYAAVLRKSDKHSRVTIIVFLQQTEAMFDHYELRFKSSSYVTSVRIADVRYVRSRVGLTDPIYPGSWVYNSTIRDTKPVLIVANNGYRSAKAFCFHESQVYSYDVGC